METNIRNKCKAYTSLEQSKKLAEILPPESADMYYAHDSVFDELESIPTITEEDDHFELFPNDVGCWSLAALLGVLPDIHLKKYIYDGITKYYTTLVGIKQFNSEHYDNPVDACVAMIEKLHELKML